MNRILCCELPVLNRSLNDFDIYDKSIPVDNTGINLYNEQGNCTLKPVFEPPNLLLDDENRIARLHSVGRIRCYIHRNGEKRVSRYKGYKGRGYLVLLPSRDSNVYSIVGYYVFDKERGDRKNER